MDLLATSDLEAWGRFFDLFRPPLVDFAAEQTKDCNSAKDLAQQTLLKWYEAVTNSRIAPQTRIYPWLCCTCRHLYIDEYRRKRVLGNPVCLEEGDQVGTIRETRLLMAIDVQTCLERRTDDERRVLREIADGRSLADLQQLLRIPKENLRRHVNRLKKLVSECLKSRGWDAETIVEAFRE